MKVVKVNARATKQAPADRFTGVVYQDEVVTPTAPTKLRASVVSFTPGARTAWHSHPLGQTLYALSGVGRICFEGQPPQVLEPGDSVVIPPNTRHWHGAAPDRLFAHLAMSEEAGGTDWFEHVSDADYATKPA